MPTDSYYDKIDKAEDDFNMKERARVKQYWSEKFKNMTLEEKVQFFVDQYIKEKVNKI